MKTFLKKLLVWLLVSLGYGIAITLLSISGLSLGGIPAALLSIVAFGIGRSITSNIGFKYDADEPILKPIPKTESEDV